ncbi:M20 family metallopeptidase [Clostridium sp. PL3]|uniref:M20 family metallopeptidase n=1 Tax=Clostridium thailandense TaxID=2794346 RepID=A0A949TUV6_9CLOT|nr:M20 family metallopeptidase [Clostridium thailandense]MBV7271438.1 M20 family metallopeptidase [Clostridium thailandense]
MILEQKKKAFEFIDFHKNEMLALWEELVNTESGARDKESVDNLAVKLKNIIENIGMNTKIVEYKNAGNSIVAEFGTDRRKKGIVFSGHMDTVFKKDTAKNNPFRIENGKAYGPGVLDMKGGIVIALYAIKALNSVGYNERPIKLIISGDEETGHSNNPAGAELFINEAKGFTAAFNFETGFTDNGIIVGRKGVAQYTLEVEGVSAHAGNAPEKGRSAIEEIAHKVLDIQNLTNWEEGINFNAGTIQGGTVSNAIPDYAKVEIDVRYTKVSKKAEITKSLEEIAAKTYVEGTKTKLTVKNFMYPMETTDGVMNLFELAKNTSIEIGFGEVYPKTTGGGSDASNTVIAGVPTICAVGVKGEWNHTSREYAEVESLFERTKFVIACVMNLKDDLV